MSQFQGEAIEKTLTRYIQVPDVYATGRLDKDSEGLLLLTSNGQLQHALTHPKFKCWKKYWVQIEGIPLLSDLEPLKKGVTLNDGPCLPAKVQMISPPALWPRNPPVRFRQSIPTSWLEIEIHEGRNRQVRRMTAKIGFPTLRLVRVAIGPFSLGMLQPGEWRWLYSSELSKWPPLNK